MNTKIKFCRLERQKTGSWIAYELPKAMTCEDSYLWLDDNMPGWEFVSGCYVNPDNADNQDEPPPR
jgi:hypothetical protein